MDVLHISDLHFGPRHWEGNDKTLLKKINSFEADIVINTGDNTTDGLQDEYAKAGRFLKAINVKMLSLSLVTMTKEICDHMNYLGNIFIILR